MTPQELHHHIETTARAEGVIKEGEFVGDWALVFHIQGLELLESNTSAYGHMYKDGTLPDHVAEGLYRTGIKLMNPDLPSRDDDDE